MYTLLFHREKGDSTDNNEFRIHFLKTEPEVHRAIRLLSFEQRRRDCEAQQTNRYSSYYFGDYGFVVIKDGKTLFCNHGFTDAFDEYSIPPSPDDVDDEMDCHQTINQGVRQYDNVLNELKKTMSEEKLHEAGVQEYKKELLRLETENKEKALLKSLLEKYPDMKL